jgi:hypothetical protein
MAMRDYSYCWSAVVRETRPRRRTLPEQAPAPFRPNLAYDNVLSYARFMVEEGMRQLLQVIPDPDVLLRLEQEELAAKLLLLLRARPDLGARYHAANLADELWHQNIGQLSYPREQQADIRLAIAEAFAWLEAQGLAVPDDGINGSNGWRRLENEADFTQYTLARRLPRDALNAKIAQSVWLAFMRGEFGVAVFQAMKAVEVAVREASGLAGELGARLNAKSLRSQERPAHGACHVGRPGPSSRPVRCQA